MDRFVTRAPTWKTLEMSSFSRSFANVSLTGKKSTPKQDKPRVQTNQRLSIRDENLLKIFTGQADEPLMVSPAQEFPPLAVRFNGSFGGGSVAVSRENYSQHSRRLVSSDENTPPPNAQITFNNEPAADVVFSSGESNSRPSTPIANMIPAKLASCTPKQNPFLAQIQRDLNSPSAATRVRAIKALRSPSKSAYTHFDVPHEEQDIITEEERKTPIKVSSIQELMKDVVVYVEVRTGEDNRSSGVKKVISALGAKVNDKLLRDTTHVVFKDGLLSTYNKAKKWNIPIVSILWIEACKKQMRLMSPKDFPISNADRYENPELYDKMKRYKSMQPDAEENRRAKATTKENAVKTKQILATTSNVHATKKKTEITRFFTKAEKAKNAAAPSSITKDSPSTQMLKKINENFCSSRTASDSLRQLAYLDSVSSLSDTIELTPKPVAPKTILGSEEINTEIPSSIISTRGTPSRRRNSIQVAQTPQKNNQNMHNIDSRIQVTPGVRTRRRSSIHIPTNMNITEEEGDKSLKIPFSTISEEVAGNPIQEDEKRQTTHTEKSIDITKCTPLQKPSNTRRRTLYTPRPMEESKLPSPKASINKRRTVFATTSKSYDGGQSMEMSSIAPVTPITGGIPSSTLIGEESVKTPLQFSSLLEEHASATIFSSTKTPANHRRRTLFDVSMDIIGQRLQNINQSAKSVRVAQTNHPETIDRRSSQDDPDTIAALLTPTGNNNNTIRRELFVGNNDSTQKQPTTAAAIPSHLDTSATTTTPLETITKKKRKLFVPNEILLTPTPQLSATEPENSTANTKRIRNTDTPPIKTPVNSKRRRTIMPTLTQSKTEQKKPPPKNSGAVARSSRRSTMDFEAIKKAKSVIKKSTEAAAHTADSAVTNNTKPKPYPFLVYTNMHTEQIEFIKEAISTLSGFQLEDNVSENTTHIVSLESRRTVNLLRGLIRGLWIVNYNWVVDSVAAGQWLNEEQYELREFSRAIEICRSERQAFGKGYKMYLFADLGPMYISSKSSIPKDCLKELVGLCAGRVTDQRKRAKYIIGDSSPDLLPNKIYLNPQWILDSISNNQIQKLTKYFVTTTTEEKPI